ncbi:uncharacterized protein LOC133737505 [Rosa rugosa]|uniref:uncharacterized protein LOC133737505 n=1 Tax=Rosa rugosa TaxID=74645 RepID=UPI002B411028|nr:uncharacterized protein LOC133737505 [Rosa rugosa]
MNVDVLSWNCRGICNTTTTRALRDLIAQNRPQIVFLCETKISLLLDFEKLHRELGFAHSKEVLSEGQAGGLGMFWTEDLNVQIRTVSSHHIDMEVSAGPGEPRWRLTGFYGYARTCERDLSWQLLRDLCDLDSLPWVIIGDFNEILNNGEKVSGPIRPERQMRGFREALGYGELVDLGFQGNQTTWWNSETQLRLDRAVATTSWSDIFGFSRVRHLAPSDSDHIPILLQASIVPLPLRPRRHRFKFESFWLQHEECDPLVISKWQTTFEGVPMYALTRKIMCTRLALEKWQRNTFKWRQQQMLEVRGKLESLMGATVSDAVNEEKSSLMTSLQGLLAQEEAFWKQRAKITWLQEGDRNSGFFHRRAANRKRKNSILGLFDANGVWQEDDSGVEGVVTSYFSNMFTATPLDSEAIELTLAALQPCVTPEMNQKLCELYTEEEVRIALFQMYPTKSPGPDGMPPLFFQHYWESIGKDVTMAVQSFLHTGSMLKQINFTHICLIPKVQQPETMSDLRPIALCNVIYKLCSKVIANRLKVFLPDIISRFQSAFVPGRLITDNTLVANEVAHYVHNKREGPDGYMALKLDLSKAYDKMEWSFLRKVLVRFGFAQGWIDVVMQCVCSVRYSFLVRGKPRGYVIPSRGLRQGDPLSPYLFLLGAEGFSALLQQKQRLGLLPGIAICPGAPHVNHLLFADDSMLYAQASSAACFQIKDVIETYGRASGQVVNFHKSSVVFSKNVGVSDQETVANLLGVEIVESHERYLGLPTYVGRKKTATFEYIKERLAEKMKHWQGKLLSGAVHASPSYSWWSIFATRDFIQSGSLWQIGDGHKVSVWNDAWIPNLPTFRPQGILWRAECPTLVKELITTPNSWNENKIWTVFLPEDAEAILSIPLSSRNHEDRLTWQLEKQGMFTVKSAYRSAFTRTSSQLSPAVVANQRVWKKIWHAKMPSSAKVTAWKICHNILPTMDRLAAKNVVLDSQVCVLCNSEPETIIHLCRNCPFSRAVLRTNDGIRRCCLEVTSDQMEALDWIHFCSEKLTSNVFAQLLFFLWGIWKERNARVWEKRVASAIDVAILCSTRLSSYVFHNSKLQSGTHIRRVLRWQPPPPSWLKLNFDGAFHTGKAAVGFLIRDSEGSFIQAAGMIVTHVQSAEHVELLACKAAVDFVLENNMQPIIFETDCLVLQQNLSRRDRNTSLLGRVYDDIADDMELIPCSRILHVRREANVAAHLLAAHASATEQDFLLSSIPPFLHNVIAAEQLVH